LCLDEAFGRAHVLLDDGMASRLRLRLLLAATLLTALPGLTAKPSTVGVAILQAVPWSPHDSARDGAGEFEVFLRIAQLRQSHQAAALVSVGDRNGVRRSGGEKALAHAALSGLPVARLAPGGAVAAVPLGIFLDGGTLSPEHTQRVLEQCLERHGAPPAAANPERPTARELTAIRAHLQPFQTALNVAAAALVAQG
jgi:hypothetical protein